MAHASSLAHPRAEGGAAGIEAEAGGWLEQGQRTMVDPTIGLPVGLYLLPFIGGSSLPAALRPRPAPQYHVSTLPLAFLHHLAVIFLYFKAIPSKKQLIFFHFFSPITCHLSKLLYQVVSF